MRERRPVNVALEEGRPVHDPRARRLPLMAIAAGALFLTAATPPAWYPLAPLLVLPGLAVQFAVATAATRPLLASYWLGALHIGAFSWSLRHVTWVGWLAIALLGGCYFVAAAVATRAVPRWRALAFGAAVAGVAWLRAEMPGISYPHGQPCHAFACWPLLLGPVRLGGEGLANALLGALAAAAVLCARGWRTGVPDFKRARRGLAAWSGGLALLLFVFAPGPRSQSDPTVSIAAIEPGIHPFDVFADLKPGDHAGAQRRWREIMRQRWLVPTQAVAGREAATPPDLVLWPESSVLDAVKGDGDGRYRFDAMRGAFDLSAGVRVCLGAERERDDGRSTPAAVLVDGNGVFIAHQEKQRLVPGGEFLPFVDWLPEAWAARVRRWLQTAVGLPDCVPGTSLPLLRLAANTGGPPDGVPFAAMVCYDNAFPDVSAAAVAQGARFLAVLSNEAWYRGGGERDQLAAITILRALATDTPIVRCTTDGLSFAVDRDGRVVAALPPAPAPTPEARVLRVDLPLGEGRLPPMARAHPWLGWSAAFWVVLACLQAALPWARILRPGRTSAGS